MSKLQDKLDRGEITPREFFHAWDEQMAEHERLHPGFHDRLYEHLMAKYPGVGADADEFFASEYRAASPTPLPGLCCR
jgi:hypothetical protein